MTVKRGTKEESLKMQKWTTWGAVTQLWASVCLWAAGRGKRQTQLDRVARGAHPVIDIGTGPDQRQQRYIPTKNTAQDEARVSACHRTRNHKLKSWATQVWLWASWAKVRSSHWWTTGKFLNSRKLDRLLNPPWFKHRVSKITKNHHTELTGNENKIFWNVWSGLK